MRSIAAMTLGLLVATGCASTADLDRVTDEAAHYERAAAQYRERANRAEAQLRQTQAELRKARWQVRAAEKSCQPTPPASRRGELDDEAIQDCLRTMRMLTPDGGSPTEWLRACGAH